MDISARQAGVRKGHVLKGAKPVVKFELVIHRRRRRRDRITVMSTAIPETLVALSVIPCAAEIRTLLKAQRRCVTAGGISAGR
jgi:hypothetical protein